MPLYEYYCQTCGSSKEEIRKFKDKDEVCQCEECKEEMIRMSVQPTSFRLTGSGWFNTGGY